MGQARPGRPRGRLTPAPRRGRAAATRMDKDVLHGPRSSPRANMYLFEEGRPLQALRQARRPPAGGDGSDGLGPTRRGLRHRRLQRMDAARHSLAAPITLRNLGGFHPRCRPGHPLQISRHLQYGPPGPKARPVRFHSEAPPLASPSGTYRLPAGATRSWMAGRRHRRPRARSPSTKSILVPGAASEGAQPLPDLPRGGAAPSRVCQEHRVSPMSSSCRSWSTPFTARGDIRPPATSRPPAATARRRTSCTSSTTSTRTDRRDPRLGALPFPRHEHGLAYYDGTHLYEHADPREGFHPDWKSPIFNYGRAEVRSFL